MKNLQYMQKIYKGNFTIIIPARWKSSRFPGKPLEKINGVPMLERVVSICNKAVVSKKVIVATDDNRIKKFCISKKINFLMTSSSCLTGTDRIIEIAKKTLKYKNFINVQGDEPLLDPKELQKFINYSIKNSKEIIIAKCLIDKDKFFEKNIPKIVTDNNDNLLYISRGSIPMTKDGLYQKAYGQVNLYSYPIKVLMMKGLKNKKTKNEKIEDIEILRFIEKGLNVKVLKMKKPTQPVDEKKDIRLVEKILNNK